MPWDFALILFALGVLVPWRGAVKIRELLARPHLTSAERISVYASTIAWQGVAAGLVLWRSTARGLGLRELGLTMPDPELAILLTLVLAPALIASQLKSLRRLARLPEEKRGFLGEFVSKLMPQSRIELLVFASLALTVGVCEEFLYRGFALAALAGFAAGSLVIAAIGSSVLFSLAHLYQGRRGLLITFVVGLLLAGTRIWTQSLAPAVVTHIVADLVVGLAAPRYLKRPPTGSAAPAAVSGSAGPAEEER